MINFLFGNEGCGKSTVILERIKNDTENKKSVILLVPEQQTVISEREIATLLPASSQYYCEATNFTRFANKVFREFGGLKYNYISQSGKNLAMYRALCMCGSMLTEYKIEEGREKSCVGLFLGAIGELKAYSVTPDKIQAAIDYIDTEIDDGDETNARFRNKLKDISLVWSSYEKVLEGKFSDNLNDLTNLANMLRTKECKEYLKHINIYIDSFYSFTKNQIDVIKELFKYCESVTVALDCPLGTKTGAMQYAKITDARDKLYAICENDLKIKPNEESFNEDKKHNNESIKTVCDNIWDFGVGEIPGLNGINLVKAGDEFEECEYVASKIRELTFKNRDLRYSEIAVLMRNSDTYKGIIDFSFDKFDIPYFYSVPTDITSMPVIKMVFSALASISNYRYEDIISYIKCGYTDIKDNDLNDFESYMFRWNIYGKKFKDVDYWSSNPDGYVSEPTRFQLETLSRVNKVRDAVIDKLSILENCFSKKCSVSDAAKSVFEFLEAHDVKKKLQKEIYSSSRQDGYELSQIWNIFISALDEMVTICGDSYVGVDDFATLLRYALSENKITTIPSGEDNVLIGDAPTVRANNIKHVFILGVNEGVFPKEISDEGFFTDTDKVTLETLGITLTSNANVNFELSSKTKMRNDDELLSFRHALSLASDGVTVSCLKTNIKGTAMLPSMAFLRISTLLGKIKDENSKDTKKDKSIDTSTLLPIDRIYTETNANEQLGSYDYEVCEAIKEYYNNKKPTPCGFSNDNLSISNDTAKEIFNDHISLSKSSMETFASCKLKYYCESVLKLKSSSKISFASNNIGTLNHLIIERFFNMKRDGKIDIDSVTKNDVEKIVEDIISSYSMLICKSANNSKKLRYLFNKLKKNLVLYLLELVSELKQSKFNEHYMELSLSGDGICAPKSLKFDIDSNVSVSLKGTADRVDVFRDNDTAYVKVIDYKSGTEKISLDLIDKGYGAQLFIYLFTLCKMKDCDFKEKFMGNLKEIKPAGIMYFPMNISKNSVKFDVDLESPSLNEFESSFTIDRIERSGCFLDDSKVIKAQDMSGGGKFIPSKDEHSDWYLRLQDFEDIYTRLENAIKKIGSEILSGDASAAPDDSMKDPCEYCEHYLICRKEK